MNGSGIVLHLSAMLLLSGKRYRVRLASCGRVRCEPGWHLGPEWAPRLRDFDLWFVWAGRGRMVTDAGEVELEPGSVFWMRPGRRYEAEQDAAVRLGVSYVHFELEDERARALSSRWVPPFEVMRTRRADLIDAALRRVIELVREPAGEEAAPAWVGAILADLAREQAQGAGATEAAGLAKLHHDLVERVVARIRESPAEAPTVAELAREAGYSPDHFARIFARATGRGPQEYVIDAKMERARRLLAESSLSVGMIAEALGFREVFFFSRQFSQRTGVSPSEYRKALERISTRRGPTG
jgi:AraC-like DNA-binding protein/mannose-6-phosphate isomerase-like protein (cupin superfamily)